MAWNFILYLLYGLTFFTLGVAILSRDIRLSELGIARIIWLLAVFGIIHGFHEWLELLEQLAPDVKSPLFSAISSGRCQHLFPLSVLFRFISQYHNHSMVIRP